MRIVTFKAGESNQSSFVLVDAQTDVRGIRTIKPLPIRGPIPFNVVGKRQKAGDQYQSPTAYTHGD